MTSENAPTGTKLEGRKREIEAINSLTTALKVSGIDRMRRGDGETARSISALTNGDPAPLMLWGEEW